MNRPNAILFDADGVFQRPPSDLALRLSVAMGVAPARAGDFILDIFRAEAEALTGAKDFQADVGAVFKQWGVSAASGVFEDLWHTIEIDHSVLGVIADMRKRGVFCGLTSNQQRRRAWRMSEELGYAGLFDAEFYSCHLGHRKPSEDYFLRVLRSAHLVPARTLFIDDRLENIDAARRVGITAEQFELAEGGNNGDTIRALTDKHGF